MSKKISKPKTKAKIKSKAKPKTKAKAKSKGPSKLKAKAKAKTKIKAKTKAAPKAKKASRTKLTVKSKTNIARTIITRSPEICILEGFTTPDGHPVEHPSVEFIDSIALELHNKGTLNPGDFGPYSIFCTFSDFIQTKNYWTNELITSMISSDHHLGNGCGTNCVLDQMKPKIQSKLRAFFNELGLPYSEHKASFQNPEFIELIQEYISSQSPERQTALALLNGMLNFDLSLLLLFLSGRVNFHDFSEIVNAPYELDDPDQLTEQSWLHEIREFLILTGEEPTSIEFRRDEAA